jgi:hypothetical protein
MIDMSISKELFMAIRQLEQELQECNGNCLECIKDCEVTQKDIADYVKLKQEEE